MVPRKNESTFWDEAVRNDMLAKQKGKPDNETTKTTEENLESYDKEQNTEANELLKYD